MLVCIPSDGSDIDHDTVCRHFGSAPFFTLYDTEADEVNVIANSNAHHSHGQCHPMSQLDRYHIDGLVCAGLGRRAAESLQGQGITLYRTEVTKISGAIALARDGKLVEVSADEIGCGQGEHRRTRAPEVVDVGPGGRRGAGRGQSRGSSRGQGGGAGQGRRRGR